MNLVYIPIGINGPITFLSGDDGKLVLHSGHSGRQTLGRDEVRIRRASESGEFPSLLAAGWLLLVLLNWQGDVTPAAEPILSSRWSAACGLTRTQYQEYNNINKLDAPEQYTLVTFWERRRSHGLLVAFSLDSIRLSLRNRKL